MLATLTQEDLERSLRQRNFAEVRSRVAELEPADIADAREINFAATLSCPSGTAQTRSD